MRFRPVAASLALMLSALPALALDQATEDAMAACEGHLLQHPDYPGVTADSVTVLPASSDGGTVVVNWHIEAVSITSGTCTVTGGSVTDFAEVETTTEATETDS